VYILVLDLGDFHFVESSFLLFVASELQRFFKLFGRGQGAVKKVVSNKKAMLPSHLSRVEFEKKL